MDERLALTLEELLMDPRTAETYTTARGAVPVGLLDQLDAAMVEARLSLQTAERSPTFVDALRLPGWFRLTAIDALAGFLVGSAATCTHAPAADHPQPVLAAAWRPGLVVCTDCTHLLNLPLTSQAGLTCDGCGYVCAGSAADSIYEAVVQVGVMLVRFGLCGSCVADLPNQGSARSSRPRRPRRRRRG